MLQYCVTHNTLLFGVSLHANKGRLHDKKSNPVNRVSGKGTLADQILGNTADQEPKTHTVFVCIVETDHLIFT